MRRAVLLLCLACVLGLVHAEGLNQDRLGVVYDRNDGASSRIAAYYAQRRHIPPANVVGLGVPGRATITRDELKAMRAEMLDKMPSSVEALLLVWSRPYAVECMSITTAMAAGYQPGFCEPGCQLTTPNPLYDTDGWLPADTVGWLPAMLIPSADEALARALIDRGIGADATRPGGTVYLVRTRDASRNVRADRYAAAEQVTESRVSTRELNTPVETPVDGIIAYFTGVARVEELPGLHFRPGGVGDHLTSGGGILEGGGQMSALEWIRQGATGSYGAVSEPCNHLEKFSNPAVFLDHYLRGDTLLEAYWKSVAMPGQGLFVGEPLARPFGKAR